MLRSRVNKIGKAPMRLLMIFGIFLLYTGTSNAETQKTKPVKPHSTDKSSDTQTSGDGTSGQSTPGTHTIISEEEQRKQWDAKSQKLKKSIVAQGETWNFPKCKEMTSGGVSSEFGSGQDRVRVSSEKNGSDSIKISITGEEDEPKIGEKSGVRGLLSREIFPTTFESNKSSAGESERSWASRKWYGDSKLWQGESVIYPPYLRPLKKGFEYLEDGEHKIVSTYLWTEGKSNAEHFRQDNVTVSMMYRFDNRGNAAVFKVEVNDKGERVFKIRATCGNGFGYEPTNQYESVSKANPTIQRLLANIKYTENPDFK